MASNRNNPYAKRRQKVKKPTDPKANPFKKELDNKRNKKLIGAVVGIIVIVMIGTMILPYMSGGGTKNYTLPNSVLTADEQTSEAAYNAQQISLGETFNRIDDEYYVLLGSAENISEFATSITRETYYTVDTTKAENKEATKDVSKGKELPQKPSEVKIKKDAALILIKKGKATKFINTKSEVKKYIDKLK